tara:strand:- start:1463 stop:2224 length:762 start_codon:yes stop_codon:yes gene_type:complete
MFITSLLESRTDQAIEDAAKLREKGVCQEPIGQLHSNPSLPVEHITGPNILEAIRSPESKLWYTYIWNWWGETARHEEVPSPREGECSWRWGPKELAKLEGDWRFAVQIRDPRSQIESVRRTAGEQVNPQQVEDPENYFIALCKGARNRYRIVLDCMEMDNYYCYKFEDLIEEPLETVNGLFRFYGLQMDTEAVTRSIDLNRKSSFKDSHSSFNKSSGCLNRFETWTRREKDIFKEIAGKELIELGYEGNEEW